MKILIVNYSDIEGGASRAAYRLYQSLLKNKIEVKMLVLNKRSDDFNVITLNDSRPQKIFNKLRPFLDNSLIKFYKGNAKAPFSPSLINSGKIIDKINEIKPDIVHLHWINGGMIKIEDLLNINAPIVWSLHDMWVFTGGCHYSGECESYKKKCGNCKLIESKKSNDLSRKIFNRKQRTYSLLPNMTIVGLSNWLNECSKNSALLSDKQHFNLPNPINTEIFKPFEKEKSRLLWNLPKNKKLILFGAVRATDDIRKGFIELSQSLQTIDNNDIELVIFGSSKPSTAEKHKFKIHYLGHLHDDISLVTIYNAVDVMIVPSLQENLSNAIMESLSCGTPVVGFDIGGNSDMITHKKMGYLAKPFDKSDLAYGINWVLNHSNYDGICSNAREKIISNFNMNEISNRYIDVYEKVLNK